MNCEQINGRLSAYIDQQLPAWEKTLVAGHTAHCLHCQAEIAQLLSVKFRLKNQNKPTLPSELCEAILEETVARPRVHRFSRIWWFPALAAMAAAAGWLILEHQIQTPRPIPIAQASHPPHAPPHSIVAWRGPVVRSDSEQTQ